MNRQAEPHRIAPVVAATHILHTHILHSDLEERWSKLHQCRASWAGVTCNARMSLLQQQHRGLGVGERPREVEGAGREWVRCPWQPTSARQAAVQS